MLKRKTLTPENALTRLEAECSRTEHCTSEMFERLRKWGITGATASKIVEHLQAENFINDRRYASAFVRNKLMFNHWGRRKISVAMMLKHIDRTIIREALEQIDETDYRDILLKTMRTKARQIKEGNTYEGRTKLYRAMLSRGFESAAISAIIRNPESMLWES